MLPKDYIDDPEWTSAIQQANTKLASVQNTRSLNLPEDQYGGIFLDSYLNVHPRYEMDTPQKLAMSAAYLLHGRHNLNKTAAKEVANNLLDGYFGYGIIAPSELVELAKHATGFRKMSVEESVIEELPKPEMYSEKDYAIKIAGVGRFRIASTEDAREAVNYFEEKWQQIPPEMRRGVACAFEKNAAAYKVPPGTDMKRYLGNTKSWLFKAAMINRGVAAPAFAEIYNKLAEDTSKDLELLALKIAEVDKASGVASHWDTVLPDPWMTVYDNTEKLGAEAFEVEIGGDRITGEDLLLLADSKPKIVEDTFSSDFVAEFMKNPIKAFRSAGPATQRVLANLAKQTKISNR